MIFRVEIGNFGSSQDPVLERHFSIGSMLTVEAGIGGHQQHLSQCVPSSLKKDLVKAL